MCVRAQMCGRVPGAAGSLDCKSQTGLWETAEIRPTARGTEVRSDVHTHASVSKDRTVCLS